MKLRASNKEKIILFVCTGNACRSQMAEGFARKMLPEGWRALSAGTIASGVHPMAIEVMREVGIDISGQYSKTLNEISIEKVDRVVTLCGNAREHCPVFPKAIISDHWPIEDPIYATHLPDALKIFRRVRDAVGSRIEELCKDL